MAEPDDHAPHQGDDDDPHIPDGLLELHVAIEADRAGMFRRPRWWHRWLR